MIIRTLACSTFPAPAFFKIFLSLVVNLMDYVNKIHLKVLLFCLVIISSACQQESSVNELDGSGQAKLDQTSLPIVEHDYDEIILEYFSMHEQSCSSIRNDVSKTQPDLNEATLLYLEAICYSQTDEKEDEDTIELLREAFKLAPNDKQGVNQYALISYQSGSNDEIIKVHKHALTLSPENIELYAQLALTYEDTDKPDKAIAVYQDGIEFARENKNKELLSDLYTESGEVHYNEGEFRQALEYYRLAIENNAQPSAYLYNLTGMVYDDLEESSAAIEMYKKSISADDTFACAYSNLGFTLIKNDKYEEAKINLIKGLEVVPDYSCNGMVYYNLGVTYREDDCEEALKNFELAIQNDIFENGQSTENGVNYNIGRCHVILKNYDDGINYLLRDKLLDEDSYLYLGKAYLGKMNFAKAEESLKKSIDENENAEALEVLANIYFNNKDFNQAKKLYKRAIEVDPEISLSYARLGFLEARDHNYEKAVKYYKKALRKKPDDIEYKSQIVMAHLKNKNCKAAEDMINIISNHDDISKLRIKLDKCKNQEK